VTLYVLVPCGGRSHTVSRTGTAIEIEGADQFGRITANDKLLDILASLYVESSFRTVT